MGLFGRSTQMVTPDRALPGRPTPLPVPENHHVNGHRIQPPFPEGLATAVFGMGCFWGSEELYWQVPGVWSTAVGYAGGFTENPTYEETCTGRTGHTEAVLVVYDPAQVSYQELLKIFWESHDPTQGMRQGNDLGSQYRSAIYWTDDAQREAAEASAKVYGEVLAGRGFDPISTEIAPLGPFYWAEGYHQQYLAKNPHGYRCHSTTGIPYPATAS
jgi:peptide-methionine (S)-S-oxide reductase